MKLAKATKNNQDTYGLVQNNHFFEIKANFKEKFPTWTKFIVAIDCKLNHRGNIALCSENSFKASGVPLETLKLLPPIAERNKIICVGINYPKLYNDLRTEKPNHIILFSKFYETLVGDREPLLLPIGKAQNTFDYEAEVAVVIGRAGFGITRKAANKHILGYTLFNDGSVREWQNHSIEAGKNFYHSGACGPYIVTKDEIVSNNKINFKTSLNGKLVQTGRLNEMFFNIDQIIEYVSSILPLNPGDIIATGSPEGTGASQKPKRFLRDGDIVKISSEILGTLTNTVKKIRLQKLR